MTFLFIFRFLFFSPSEKSLLNRYIMYEAICSYRFDVIRIKGNVILSIACCALSSNFETFLWCMENVLLPICNAKTFFPKYFKIIYYTHALNLWILWFVHFSCNTPLTEKHEFIRLLFCHPLILRLIYIYAKWLCVYFYVYFFSGQKPLIIMIHSYYDCKYILHRWKRNRFGNSLLDSTSSRRLIHAPCLSLSDFYIVFVCVSFPSFAPFLE